MIDKRFVEKKLSYIQAYHIRLLFSKVKNLPCYTDVNCNDRFRQI